MQAATPAQTSQPRLVRAVLKWLLIALLAAWTVVASAYLLIHAVIVPRIELWRTDAEQQLSETLGAPVRIGVLSAKASQWTSHFEVRDVQVGAEGADAAVFIPAIQASLSMRGLWRLEFDQVQVTSPSVQVQRHPDGSWHIGPIALAAGTFAQVPAWQDWLFDQPELLVRDARISLQDDMDGVGPSERWVVQNVDVALRSGVRSHAMRIDLTPPAHVGQRLSVQAQFDSPLFSMHGSDWRQWQGVAYGQWPQLDAAALHAVVQRFAPNVADKIRLDAAQAAWRGWLDFERGATLKAFTSDVVLTDVAAAWMPDKSALKPMLFKRLQARLDLRQQMAASAVNATSPDGRQWAISLDDMAFETQQGVRWDGAQLDVAWPARNTDQSAVRLANINLDVLRQLSDSLPLPAALRSELGAWRPTGYINELQLDWQGSLDKPRKWHTSGSATELGWAPGQLRSNAGDKDLARPGAQGVGVQWRGSAEGGSAQVSVTQGQLTLPGVWQAPTVALPSLQANVVWSAPGHVLATQDAPAAWTANDWQQLWRVAFDNVQITTPDGQVSASGVWAQDPQQASTNAAGYLRLDAGVNLLAVNKLARYLPRSMDADAMSFVQSRLSAGTLSQVKVHIDSHLDDALWSGGAQRFGVTAQASGVDLDYAGGWGPEQTWPAVGNMSGQFAMSGNNIDISNVTARLRDAPQVVVSQARVQLRDMGNNGQLLVEAQASGPLPTWLAQLSATPVARWSDGLMQDWRGQGDATLALTIETPLANPNDLRVRGEVGLQDTSLTLWSGVPALQNAHARVRFDNNSVTVDQVRAQWLGSPLNADLRWSSGVADSAGELVINVNGRLNANAVAQTPSLGTAAMLAQRASGSTAFEASARSTTDGLAWQLRAPLTNLRLDLPQPLNKASGQTWPLAVSVTPLPAAQRAPGMASAQDIVLSVGPSGAPVVHAHYVREFAQALMPVSRTAAPSMVRGAVGLGQFDVAGLGLPDQGVLADIRLANFNVDDWQQVLLATSRQTGMSTMSDGRDDAETVSKVSMALPDKASAELLRAYLPTTMVARALSLTTQGRSFNNVVLGGARVGPLWRANVRADELNGYLQYRESDAQDGGAGNLYARLAMLHLAKQETQDIVQMLAEQPRAMPALDVVVQSLNLDGRDLGRLELQAFNRVVARVPGQRANEWRLNRLWLDVPEASLRANGQWAPVLPDDTAEFDANKRRTFLDFELELRDSGELLSRFGMPGVVRGSAGTVKGQVAWLGAPTNFDTTTLNGGLDLSVASGQFLKADPGIARLIGVLSLQSLPRRLLLDFRDVFLEGFAFDSVTGNARITNGLVQTNNLQMAGVNATVLMEGQASMVDETQALQVVVVPQVDAGTLSLLAASANPVVGVATYFLERVFGEAINTANTKAFQVTGSWLEPQVEEVKLTPRDGKAPVQTVDISEQAAQAVKQLGAGAATVSTQPEADMPVADQ